MIKNLIRGLIVFAAFACVFILCEKVLMLKSEDGIEQMESYYLQKENTVDALLLGSSHIYCNVNTGTLWDEYGISAFDLGGAEQPYWNSYYYLKEALKTQRPKVIIMSVTIPGIRFDDYQSENWLITNLYGMHWNANRIKATKESTLDNSFWRILFPMNTIHSRYADLTRDDFEDRNKDISYKGYSLRSTTVPCMAPDVSDITEMTKLTDKQEKYYKKIIELTKEENIPLLLVSVPYSVSSEAQKVYNYEFAIAEEEGIDYIDFNKCYDEFDLNFETDMAEELHLNISGSRKFTTYLGKIIKEKYGLPNHQGDALYSSWEEDALINRQEIACAKLQENNSVSEYCKLLSNDNYITFVNFGANLEPASLAAIRSDLKVVGINPDNVKSNYSAIVCGKNELFSSGDNSFEAFIDQGADKLLLKRSSTENEAPKTEFYNNSLCRFLEPNDIQIIVYDKVLKRIVSQVSISPENNFAITPQR